MVAAGELNRRITIEEQDSTFDAAGQQALTWSTFATVWASIVSQSGMATIKSHGDADLSITRVSIRIRWLDGVDQGMRVVHGSDVYDIRSVHYDQVGHEYVDMVCFKGGSDG